MAKFDFYLSNAAANNSPAARIREHTRMACIAYGLKRLGHDVLIVDSWHEFRESNRWRFFADMKGESRRDAITVKPAEYLMTGNHHCDVAIKCSVKTSNDAALVSRCKVLVAHEYADSVADEERLLPVPFLVHDRVIDWFCESDVLEYYLDDDETLANWVNPFIAKRDFSIAFAGAGHYGRKEIAAKMEQWFPCEFILRDSPIMSGQQYMEWLSGHRFALVPNGDTPKTNRWAEACILGLVIISPEQRTKVVPPQTNENTIMPADWDDVDGIKAGMERWKEIVMNAWESYCEGWSPTGQARQICKWLGVDE